MYVEHFNEFHICLKRRRGHLRSAELITSKSPLYFDNGSTPFSVTLYLKKEVVGFVIFTPSLFVEYPTVLCNDYVEQMIVVVKKNIFISVVIYSVATTGCVAYVKHTRVLQDGAKSALRSKL